MRRFARIVIVSVVCAGGITAATAHAQTPPCPDCSKAGADAAPIRKQIDERTAELQRLQQEQGANNANLRNLRELRLEAARRDDTAAVEQYDKSIDDLQSDNRANREQQFKTQQEIQSLNEELERIGREVDACNKRCADANSKLPTGTVVNSGGNLFPDPPPTPDGVAVPPLKLPCGGCEGATELENEHKELQRRAERANGTKEPGALQDFEAQRRKVRDLQQKVNECMKQCIAPERTTSFLNPPMIGGLAGGAALVALLAGGGSDTPVLATPIANQPQPPQPQQPQQPQPDPQPTIAGTADCTACVPTDDPDRHNLVINLCPQLTGPFAIAVASITIRHAAPFVDIVGAQYDTTSGAFRGTGRGTVAGIPNVGVAAEGTANGQTGSVVFTYTMGTGGELPGGRPITYRITLQKRR